MNNQNNQNNQNIAYSNYQRSFSPNYIESKDIANFKSPQMDAKNEASQIILDQTKASLKKNLQMK